MSAARAWPALAAAFVIYALAISAQAQKKTSRQPVTWSSRLDLRSLSDIDERLKRPFEDPVEVSRNRERATVSNCLSCLGYLDRGYTAPSDRELRRLKSLTADCRALRLLKSARPSQRTAIDGTPLDPRYLPPALAFLPADEELRKAQSAQRQGRSWMQFQPDLKVEHRNNEEAIVEGATGVVRLYLYARGDFNGDGVEDLLVRDDTYPREGTYTNTRLFVLTRYSKGAVLQVLREYD